MFSIMQLKAEHFHLYEEMNTLFAEAFNDPESYLNNRPRKEYAEKLLRDEHFIALLALEDKGNVVGALVAYELRKFEQERSEIYIYDLAVKKRIGKLA